MNNPNKKTELKQKIIHHKRSKTDLFQFKKAVFINSLQELRELLQKQSDRLTLNDRIRKGVVDGGYIDPERIHLITHIENNLKSKRRNGILDMR